MADLKEIRRAFIIQQEVLSFTENDIEFTIDSPRDSETKITVATIMHSGFSNNKLYAIFTLSDLKRLVTTSQKVIDLLEKSETMNK